MRIKSWVSPKKKVRAAAFKEVVSGRGTLLTWRHKDRLWVARSGLDPRAWFLKLDEQGRGTGGWIHSRPWLDELLRPPSMIRHTRGPLLSRMRRDLKTIHRRSLHPLPEGRLENSLTSQSEGLDPATLPHLTRLWPEIVEVLAHWETRSSIRPQDARFAYARIRKTEHQLRRIEAVADWLGHFPPEALEFVERHGFKERRWHVLNLWMRVPEGRELFDEIPALAWMLASSWQFRRPVSKPFRSIRALVRKPRARILEWLGLPPGDGTLKLLRQLPGQACDQLLMRRCHAAFGDVTLRNWLLNLCMPLTLDVLLAANPGRISYPLLRAIAEGQSMPLFGARDEVARVYLDVCWMAWSLEEVDPDRLGRIRSTRQLWEFHEELVALQNSRERPSTPAWEGRKPPPVAPAQWMVPLETEEALEAEACELRHCLSSSRYRDAVTEGHYYAYAVHHELGRATLGIQRNSGEGWSIDQLRGHANGAVDPAVQSAVAEWATQHRIQCDLGSPDTLGGRAAAEAGAFLAHREYAFAGDDEGDIPF